MQETKSLKFKSFWWRTRYFLIFFVSRLGALSLIGTVTLIAAEGGGPTCKR